MKLRTLTAAIAVLALAAPAAAHADVTSAFGGKVPCMTDPADGTRVCKGDSSHLVPSWDGTTIDVNLVLPPAKGNKDGDYPLIGFYHGWGGSKSSTDSLRTWALRG